MQLIASKDSSPNDPLCVEWDVKPYTLTHSHKLVAQLWQRDRMTHAAGVGHFERKFHVEQPSPTNHCWCQQTGLIAVSCDMKISAVHCLVTSQRRHLTDGWTELLSQLLSQDHAGIGGLHGKN